MILIKLSLLIVLFSSVNPEEPLKPYISSYIEDHKYMAIDEMVRTGIPASVIMAQAIIESNAGISKLARITNNHFGIKCKDYWEGSAYYHPDDDRDKNGTLIPSCFRKYETIRDSYTDHSDFLTTTLNYRPLFIFDKTEYKSWAEGLEMCGYASDEQYAEKLIRTIELYGLHDLDFFTIKYVERSDVSPASDTGATQE